MLASHNDERFSRLDAPDEIKGITLDVLYANGTHTIIVSAMPEKGETPGRCSVLPGCAYPMYDEKTRGETASSKIEVQER
jgi:hypothetical protein